MFTHEAQSTIERVPQLGTMMCMPWSLLVRAWVLLPSGCSLFRHAMLCSPDCLAVSLVIDSYLCCGVDWNKPPAPRADNDPCAAH